MTWLNSDGTPDEEWGNIRELEATGQLPVANQAPAPSQGGAGGGGLTPIMGANPGMPERSVYETFHKSGGSEPESGERPMSEGLGVALALARTARRLPNGELTYGEIPMAKARPVAPQEFSPPPDEPEPLIKADAGDLQLPAGEAQEMWDQAATELDPQSWALGDLTPDVPTEGWHYIPEWLASEIIAGLAQKGAGHKYIRRVPTGKPKPKYRYYYKVSGGAGLGHDEEIKVGASYKAPHNGKSGHFHVTAIDGNDVTVKHDETGKSATITRGALREMLHNEHAEAIDTHRKKLKEELVSVTKHGTKKQQKRLKAEADKFHALHGGVATPKIKSKMAIEAAKRKFGGKFGSKTPVPKAEEKPKTGGVDALVQRLQAHGKLVGELGDAKEELHSENASEDPRYRAAVEKEMASIRDKISQSAASIARDFGLDKKSPGAGRNAVSRLYSRMSDRKLTSRDIELAAASKSKTKSEKQEKRIAEIKAETAKNKEKIKAREAEHAQLKAKAAELTEQLAATKQETKEIDKQLKAGGKAADQSLHSETRPHGSYSVEHHGAGVHVLKFKAKGHRNPKVIGTFGSVEAAQKGIEHHTKTGWVSPSSIGSEINPTAKWLQPPKLTKKQQKQLDDKKQQIAKAEAQRPHLRGPEKKYLNKDIERYKEELARMESEFRKKGGGSVAKSMTALDDFLEEMEKSGRKSPPKEYSEGGATKPEHYADPNGWKYPIDTEKHVRAAISYFSKPANASAYSKEEQSKIWGRIKGAAKKFKIELGEQSGPPSVEDKMEKCGTQPMMNSLDNFLDAEFETLEKSFMKAEGYTEWYDKYADTPLYKKALEIETKFQKASMALEAKRQATSNSSNQERKKIDSQMESLRDQRSKLYRKEDAFWTESDKNRAEYVAAKKALELEYLAHKSSMAKSDGNGGGEALMKSENLPTGGPDKLTEAGSEANGGPLNAGNQPPDFARPGPGKEYLPDDAEERAKRLEAKRARLDQTNTEKEPEEALQPDKEDRYWVHMSLAEVAAEAAEGDERAHHMLVDQLKKSNGMHPCHDVVVGLGVKAPEVEEPEPELRKSFVSRDQVGAVEFHDGLDRDMEEFLSKGGRPHYQEVDPTSRLWKSVTCPTCGGGTAPYLSDCTACGMPLEKSVLSDAGLAPDTSMPGIVEVDPEIQQYIMPPVVEDIEW